MILGCGVTLTGIKTQMQVGVVPLVVIEDYLFTVKRTIDSVTKMVEHDIAHSGV
jgi:hypothetical protein